MLGTEGSCNSSFAFNVALISTLATYRPCILLTVQQLDVSNREQRPPPRLRARGGCEVPLLFSEPCSRTRGVSCWCPPGLNMWAFAKEAYFRPQTCIVNDCRKVFLSCSSVL